MEQRGGERQRAGRARAAPGTGLGALPRGPGAWNHGPPSAPGLLPTDRARELPPAPFAPYPPRAVRGCRAALLLLLFVAPRGPELCPPRPASQLPVTASVPAGSGGEGRKSPAPLRSASPRPLRPRYPGTCACSGAGGQRWVEAARPFPPPLRGVRWCGPSALAPRPHPPIAGRGGRIHPSRDRLLTRRLATTRWRWRRVSAGCGPAPLLCGATSSAVLLARLLWAYRKAIHPKKRVIPMKVP